MLCLAWKKREFPSTLNLLMTSLVFIAKPSIFQMVKLLNYCKKLQHPVPFTRYDLEEKKKGPLFNTDPIMVDILCYVQSISQATCRQFVIL